nr:MAG TPA: hypothetical protein [Caudoviricetes sp.]
MDKFKVVFNILNKVGNVIVRYKEKDVSQDMECRQLLDELQEVCDSFRDIGETEGILARKISHLFLEYLCGEE